MFKIWALYFLSRAAYRARNFRTRKCEKTQTLIVVIRNKKIQRLLRAEGTLAFAMGRTIFVRSTYVDKPKLIRHERAHVRQYQREGLLFMLKYTYFDLVRGYDNNPYEIEAIAAE